MSKGQWKKHEEIDEEILGILGRGEIMTAHVVWYALNQRKFRISYGTVQRRLESLKKSQKIKILKSGSNQNLWTTCEDLG